MQVLCGKGDRFAASSASADPDPSFSICCRARGWTGSFGGKSPAKRSVILHSRLAWILICIKSGTAPIHESLTDLWIAPVAVVETVMHGTAHDFGRPCSGTRLESGNSRLKYPGVRADPPWFDVRKDWVSLKMTEKSEKSRLSPPRKR